MACNDKDKIFYSTEMKTVIATNNILTQNVHLVVKDDLVDYTLNEGIGTSFFASIVGGDLHADLHAKREIIPLKKVR